MNRFRSSWDRRKFLLAAGLASSVGSLRPSNLYGAYLAERHGESYRALGVRPLINAAGTYTTLTGSVIAPEVRDAMAEASHSDLTGRFTLVATPIEIDEIGKA